VSFGVLLYVEGQLNIGGCPMLKTFFKKVVKVVKWLFEDDEKEIQYDDVVRPFVRPAIVEAVPVPAPIVRPSVPVRPAPIVEAKQDNKQDELKKQYREWTQNMKEYDKLRQRIAQ
jgi:hypothetical protein